MKEEDKKTRFLKKLSPRIWAFIALILMAFSSTLLAAYPTDHNTEALNNEFFVIFQGNTLASVSSPSNPPLKTIATLPVIITGYSSTPEQTDDSPFITASGSSVKDGIVANNYFAFGTKIRIPELYQDKIFIIEDRMNWKKNNNHFDIWFEDNLEALAFGAKITYIEIVER